METFMFVVIYLIGSVLSYGLTFGFFQNNWPTIAEEGYRGDLAGGILAGVTSYVGIFAIILTWASSGKKLYFKLY